MGGIWIILPTVSGALGLVGGSSEGFPRICHQERQSPAPVWAWPIFPAHRRHTQLHYLIWVGFMNWWAGPESISSIRDQERKCPVCHSKWGGRGHGYVGGAKEYPSY